MRREIELRRQAPSREGTATAPYRDRHRLGAELAKMVRRGEIDNVGPIRLTPDGKWEVRYVRLREPRSKMPAYATAFAVGMGAVAGIGAMLWHARYVILAVLGTLAALAVLISLIGFVAARAQGCSCVIHGPGCKG